MEVTYSPETSINFRRTTYVAAEFSESLWNIAIDSAIYLVYNAK
jgi:hypothetical protein